MISHFSPVELANIPLPHVSPLPPYISTATVPSTVTDTFPLGVDGPKQECDGADNMCVATSNIINDGVQPDMAWGEPDAYVFAEEGVQAIANRLDHQNKKTRLTDKASLWHGLVTMTKYVSCTSS